MARIHDSTPIDELVMEYALLITDPHSVKNIDYREVTFNMYQRISGRIGIEISTNMISEAIALLKILK